MWASLVLHDHVHKVRAQLDKKLKLLYVTFTHGDFYRKLHIPLGKHCLKCALTLQTLLS